jgi:hypothetical protein
MTWVDWAIVIVLAGSVIGGLSQGLFRSVCSLCGLVFGLPWPHGTMAASLLWYFLWCASRQSPMPSDSC